MERTEKIMFPQNIRSHIEELIGEDKNISKIYEDTFLKEEIERYLGSARIQLILVSGIYNNGKETSSREDFTMDIIRSIFDDDALIYADSNVRITLGFLIRQLNTEYSEVSDFYLPIEEYRKLALKAEAVYQKEYDQKGTEGLKAVYNNFDILLEDGVNNEFLKKVSHSKDVQRDLANMIILNRRGLPMTESPEEIEDNFYNQMQKSFEKEKKNRKIKRMQSQNN